MTINNWHWKILSIKGGTSLVFTVLVMTPSKVFQIVHSIDGDKIIPDGNTLWISDKNFGMGKEHPVAWYHALDKGRTFYTSLGHDADTWKQEAFITMLVNVVNWNQSR